MTTDRKILIAMLAVVILIGVVFLILREIEDAKREEAAQIAVSSRTYADYVRTLKQKGLEQYMLTETLWQMVKDY